MTTMPKSKSGRDLVKTATTKHQKSGKSALDFVDLKTTDDDKEDRTTTPRETSRLH